MPHEVYILHDMLTLMAVSGSYPRGFVSVSEYAPHYFCLASVVSDDLIFKAVTKALSYYDDPRIKLYPTPEVVTAVAGWHSADPVCRGCKRLVRDH